MELEINMLNTVSQRQVLYVFLCLWKQGENNAKQPKQRHHGHESKRGNIREIAGKEIK
jgi:hypothetical protein